MNLPNIDVTKSVVAFIASATAGSVVKQAVTNNLEETDSKTEQVVRYLGLVGIAGAVGYAAANYTDRVIDAFDVALNGERVQEKNDTPVK